MIPSTGFTECEKFGHDFPEIEAEEILMLVPKETYYACGWQAAMHQTANNLIDADAFKRAFQRHREQESSLGKLVAQHEYDNGYSEFFTLRKRDEELNEGMTEYFANELNQSLTTSESVEY